MVPFKTVRLSYSNASQDFDADAIGRDWINHLIQRPDLKHDFEGEDVLVLYMGVYTYSRHGEEEIYFFPEALEQPIPSIEKAKWLIGWMSTTLTTAIESSLQS
jgi:hypothetical protein